LTGAGQPIGLFYTAVTMPLVEIDITGTMRLPKPVKKQIFDP
jgi:hypothetical protein